MHVLDLHTLAKTLIKYSNSKLPQRGGRRNTNDQEQSFPEQMHGKLEFLQILLMKYLNTELGFDQHQKYKNINEKLFFI